MAETRKAYLTVAEVAEVLGLRPVTIYRWCRAGRLASVKIGKEWRIGRAALDDLLGRGPLVQLGRRGDGGEPMHEAAPETRDLAWRLLRQEAGGREEAAALAEASERVCGRLRQRLVGLIGGVGFAALFGRALRLARAEFPILAGVTIEEGADGCLQGVREFAAAHAAEPAVAGDALAAILAHFIGLLITFIGEALSLRLIGESWPESARGGAAGAATEEAE